MAIKAGFDAQIFVGSAGVRAATELTLARDSNSEGNANAIDASNRSSANKEYIYGLKDQSITVTIIMDPADPGYKIILDAYLNNKVIAVFNSDGEGQRMERRLHCRHLQRIRAAGRCAYRRGYL